MNVNSKQKFKYLANAIELEGGGLVPINNSDCRLC